MQVEYKLTDDFDGLYVPEVRLIQIAYDRSFIIKILSLGHELLHYFTDLFFPAPIYNKLAAFQDLMLDNDFLVELQTRLNQIGGQNKNDKDKI